MPKNIKVPIQIKTLDYLHMMGKVTLHTRIPLILYPIRLSQTICLWIVMNLNDIPSHLQQMKLNIITRATRKKRMDSKAAEKVCATNCLVVIVN